MSRRGPYPLFFIVFMNDMSLKTAAENPTDMYADGSVVSASRKTVVSVEASLNRDLEDISQRCDGNCMVINIEKAKVMLVTTQQK